MAVLALLASACGGGGDSAAPQVHTVGVLRAVPGGNQTLVDGLRAEGYVVGTNLVVVPDDPNAAFLDPDDAAAEVRSWVADGVDLIFALSSRGAAAAAEAAPDVPVLFLVNDPVAVGLVEDPERPEGNLTGVTFRVPADRTLDLARQAIPDLATVGMLLPEKDPAAGPHRAAVEAAADALGIKVVTRTFTGDDDAAAAVAALAGDGAQAILLANAPSAVVAGEAVSTAVAEAGLPLLANTDFVSGSLVVITPDTETLLMQLARQAARILDGASPSDVPVEDPDRFRVILDTTRAAALGLELPDSLLRQADEVIR